MIFLLVFNPILQKLQENSQKGYKLGDTYHVTTPYADDFCLISTRSTSHQKLINEIHTQISSMGMKLKPKKCTSFSLSAGHPQVIPFHIGDNNIASIKDQEQKFLGKLLFFKGKSEETFSHIKNTFLEGIANIEKAIVRNEYKLWIYSNYLLPSKRFLLTVHVLTETHLKMLDTLTDKAIKKWSGLPPSATNALIHMQEGLGIRSISELYKEVHAVSQTRTRLKGDNIVNNAIDCTLERESEFTRKKSTCIEAENIYQKALDSCTVLGEIPDFSGENAGALKHKFDNQVSDKVKAVLSVERREKWENHVKELVVQGNFLALAAAEREDVVWKSCMFNLKQGKL